MLDIFLPGMNNMIKSFEKNIRTHSSLLSAMMTFGKYSGIEPNSKCMKLIGNKHIGIQPTYRLSVQDFLHKSVEEKI